MKHLIINADDFGWDEETTENTIGLFENGMLTSATIMTDRPGTEQALAYARENRNRFSFGLHFNIIDEHPSSIGRAGSLTYPESNLFKQSNLLRKDALLLKLNRYDIQKELDYQLSILYDSGIEVSHVDSHGHMHKFPQIINAMRPTLKRYRIQTVRIPQNLYQKKNFKKVLINHLFRPFFYGFNHTDFFFMLETHDDEKWFEKFLTALPHGITELGIHPGMEEEWRKTETTPVKETDPDRLKKMGINLQNFNFLK